MPCSDHATAQGAVLTPAEMAQRESLVAPPVAALLRRLAGRPAPLIVLGAPLQQAVCTHHLPFCPLALASPSVSEQVSS